MCRRTQLALLALLAACSSDGTGPDGGTATFAVTTVTPTNGATDVETGALIMAHFNAPVAPATLTSASFTLSTDSTPTPLAVAVAYDATSQTAQLVGPLLPGSTYRAAVTTAVEDTAGRALGTAREWSFSTHPWHSMTLDQGGNPSLARDATGRLHLTYSDFANLKYATCPGDCASAVNWQMGTLDQGPDFAALATEASGRLHVSYFHFVTDTLGEIRYATCAADCTTAANWQTLTLDQGTRLAMGPPGPHRSKPTLDKGTPSESRGHNATGPRLSPWVLKCAPHPPHSLVAFRRRLLWQPRCG
jgi:hypothetical protein